MPIIAVLNQKGGVGKTTLATHIARAYQLRNKDTLLIDSDPQGSARDWSAAHEHQTLPVVGLDRPTIERDIKPIIRNTDIVVIDGPPRHEQIVISAIKVSDIILLPVQPSPYDVWAVADMVDLIKQRQALLGTPKAAFVMTRVIKRTKIGADVRQALDELALPVFEAYTTQRVAYPNAAAKGLTVLDSEGDNEARAEINALVDELDRFINDTWTPKKEA